jgi:Domain of unknown function (DUF3786)
VLYEKCEEVNAAFWQELTELPPVEVARRTGAALGEGIFRLPFLNRVLQINPVQQTLKIEGAGFREPDFKLCLSALLYLARVDPALLKPLVSPLELTGGTTFFLEGSAHALPHAPLEKRFGQDLPGFLQAGELLGAQRRASGDAALALPVFPGLTVEVILWLADEEFPAQASFRVPGALEQVWHLDAVLGLLHLITRELRSAAA